MNQSDVDPGICSCFFGGSTVSGSRVSALAFFAISTSEGDVLATMLRSVVTLYLLPVMFHSVVTFLCTALGMILPIARIDDKLAEGEQSRLIGEACSVFIVGVLSTTLTLITAIKLEVDERLPVLLKQVRSHRKPPSLPPSRPPSLPPSMNVQCLSISPAVARANFIHGAHARAKRGKPPLNPMSPNRVRRLMLMREASLLRCCLL